MSAWAKPGTKCVCIEANWGERPAESGRVPRAAPALGEVLTVLEVRERYGHIYLGFSEVPDAGSDGGWFFHIGSFRPLVTRTQSQDVALFAPLLGASEVTA